MYALKGFALHELFANNTPGIISVIGELSTQSLTYAKEKGFYNKDNTPQISLVSFLSSLDGTLVQAPIDVSTQALDVAQFIYNKTLTSGNEIFADELILDLIEEFATSADNFTCGNIIHDGNYYMPEWVGWTNKALVGSVVKIWFVDQSFQSQYDGFEIVIIPPFLPIDNFWHIGSEVEHLLTQTTYPQAFDMIQQAKGKFPETVVRAEEFNYIDPMNPAHIVPSRWGLLIYGAAGDNIDSIKDALVDYILGQSTHTRDEWATILPDLFKRTEFTMLPLWQQYAIPNRQTVAGIYSPIANLTDTLAFVKTTVPAYPASHINSYASVMGHPYKSIAVAAIGGPENRDDQFQLTDVFPDYINVNTSSIDFNRMSEDTKNWLLLLDVMIQTAESMAEFTDVPIGMTRVTRDGILYLVQTFNNIHYLVAAKKNFPAPT